MKDQLHIRIGDTSQDEPGESVDEDEKVFKNLQNKYKIIHSYLFENEQEYFVGKFTCLPAKFVMSIKIAKNSSKGKVLTKLLRSGHPADDCVVEFFYQVMLSNMTHHHLYVLGILQYNSGYNKGGYDKAETIREALGLQG
jgi:hypothetical protein